MANKNPIVKAIRGAVSVKNSRSSILKSTKKLIKTISKTNSLLSSDIITIIFTMTEDLDAEFPALAVRKMKGWDNIPMLCARELSIQNSMRRVIRVLVLAYLSKEPRHQYLGKTKKLRRLK